jgi:glycosyltransferase involved in cell wall biosynthesis
MQRPKLTVIIPTRNRADTLFFAIKTVLAQPEKNIEILISDNYSTPETKDVFDSINDSRLKYIRTDRLLGMSEHWDFATNQASGEWVTILGDDDGISPHAVAKFFALTEKHPDIKAITCANCWYKWPTDENGDDAELSIIGSDGYEIRNSLESIKLILSGKPVFLPTIYTGGFIHSDVLKAIRSKSPDGKLFMCINPDIYSGMATCSVTDKYIYSYEPWCIAGNSKHSNGRKHKQVKVEDLNNLPFFTESTIKYHPIFQNAGNAGVGSHQIYFYEAYLQSDHLREKKNILNLNLADQLALAITHANKKKFGKVAEYCKKVAEVNGLDFKPILRKGKLNKPAFRIQKLGRKALKLIPNYSKLPEKMHPASDLKNIYDASVRMGEILN